MAKTNKQVIRQFLNDYYRYQQSGGGLQDKMTIETVLKLQYDILVGDEFYIGK